MAESAQQTGRIRRVLALLFLLASAIVPATAQKFKVLHTFHGAPNDGAAP